MIDRSHKRWPHVEQRLRNEVVVWITTVTGDGRPQSSPVWYLWDGEAFVVYSMPSAGKVRNIRSNPKVSVHLNDDGVGEDVATFDGTAEITDDPVPGHDPTYVEKYRQRIIDLGYQADSFAKDYSVGVRITPTRARMW